MHDIDHDLPHDSVETSVCVCHCARWRAVPWPQWRWVPPSARRLTEKKVGHVDTTRSFLPSRGQPMTDGTAINKNEVPPTHPRHSRVTAWCAPQAGEEHHRAALERTLGVTTSLLRRQGIATRRLLTFGRARGCAPSPVRAVLSEQQELRKLPSLLDPFFKLKNRLMRL
jgi:hypothetical protein